MATLEYAGKTYDDQMSISEVLRAHGLVYEHWGLKQGANVTSSESVLSAYCDEINKLKKERGYVEADLVALDQSLENLDTICAKFDKEHHHIDDEVRFVVDGEGVFELDDGNGTFMKLLTTAGDLIVIPANRRHLFYLTDKKSIRCVRLFKDHNGWDAIYEKH